MEQAQISAHDLKKLQQIFGYILAFIFPWDKTSYNFSFEVIGIPILQQNIMNDLYNF